MKTFRSVYIYALVRPLYSVKCNSSSLYTSSHHHTGLPQAGMTDCPSLGEFVVQTRLDDRPIFRLFLDVVVACLIGTAMVCLCVMEAVLWVCFHLLCEA